MINDMDTLDEMKLPLANPNEELEDISNNHFIPLFDVSKFEVRKPAGRDKGIDFKMELKYHGGITGFQICIQLKATEAKVPNQDGSISITIYTSNINYLLNSGVPAYYVLYFKKENIFLYTNLHDFVKDLSLKDVDWRKQDTHTLRLNELLDKAAIVGMYEHGLENGKFIRTLKERIAVNSSFVSDRIVIDPELNVRTDSEIQSLIENYGFYLINASRWTEIITAHQSGSQHIAKTSRYNLIVGIAWYYSGELIRSLDFFKAALRQKCELPIDLEEHLILFDSSVRFALGLIDQKNFKDRLSLLGKSHHIRYYVKIDQLKAEYLQSIDVEKAYEKYVKEMNNILHADDANENIKMLVRCELFFFEGSYNNMEYIKKYSQVKAAEQVAGDNPRLRVEIARVLINDQLDWKTKGNELRREALNNKNYFVFYHVLLNEAKISYEFDVYSNLISGTALLSDEQRKYLTEWLDGVDQAKEYFKRISYVENVCMTLSLQYEIYDYMKDASNAERVLNELTSIVEINDLRELQGRLEKLRAHGTTHDKFQSFLNQGTNKAKADEADYMKMVQEMEEMDNIERGKTNSFKEPFSIHLYPIGHFWIPRDGKDKAYDILSITPTARIGFNNVYDMGAEPIANIFHNPIEEEGFASGMWNNNRIEA